MISLLHRETLRGGIQLIPPPTSSPGGMKGIWGGLWSGTSRPERLCRPEHCSSPPTLYWYSGYAWLTMQIAALLMPFLDQISSCCFYFATTQRTLSSSQFCDELHDSRSGWRHCMCLISLLLLLNQKAHKSLFPEAIMQNKQSQGKRLQRAASRSHLAVVICNDFFLPWGALYGLE